MVTLTATITGSVWLRVSTSWEMKSMIGGGVGDPQGVGGGIVTGGSTLRKRDALAFEGLLRTQAGGEQTTACRRVGKRIIGGLIVGGTGS